jgi:hypothetical protein
MRVRKISTQGSFGKTAVGWPRFRRHGSLLVCLTAGAFVCCYAQSGQNAQSPGTDKAPQNATLAGKLTAGERAAQTDDNKPTAADPSAPEMKIAADKARLLKLATELREEIHKSGNGTLSLNVIRKADEIEKLAHSVKQGIKRPAN